MGFLWGSDEEKHTENSGGVTNKVVIGNKVDIINVEMLVLLGIICGIKVFEVICYIYRRHYQGMKKRMSSPQTV